jgi:hypothetical protein
VRDFRVIKLHWRLCHPYSFGFKFCIVRNLFSFWIWTLPFTNTTSFQSYNTIWCSGQRLYILTMKSVWEWLLPCFCWHSYNDAFLEVGMVYVWEVGGTVAVELHSVMTAKVYYCRAHDVVSGSCFVLVQWGDRSRMGGGGGMVGSVFDLDQYATSAKLQSPPSARSIGYRTLSLWTAPSFSLPKLNDRAQWRLL